MVSSSVAIESIYKRNKNENIILSDLFSPSRKTCINLIILLWKYISGDMKNCQHEQILQALWHLPIITAPLYIHIYSYVGNHSWSPMEEKMTQALQVTNSSARGTGKPENRQQRQLHCSFIKVWPTRQWHMNSSHWPKGLWLERLCLTFPCGLSSRVQCPSSHFGVLTAKAVVCAPQDLVSTNQWAKCRALSLSRKSRDAATF